MFAIYRKHDCFRAQVQVAVYRMQMLFNLRHLRQRRKYHEAQLHFHSIYPSASVPSANKFTRDIEVNLL
jgi:hypothetical protein